MDFNYSEDQITLRKKVAEFCTKHCTEEHARKLEEDPCFPEALHAAMADAGILGHCLPSEYGGGDGQMFDAALITELLGGASDAAGNILFVNFICATLIARCGSEEQRRRFIGGVADGSLRLAFAMTEPQAGSDARSIQCRADKAPDGYVLNGVKMYTTGAGAADFILIVALTDAEAGAKRGASLLIVPTDADGLTIEPLKKIAGNAVDSSRVALCDVRVESKALVGVEDQAWSPLMIGTGLERLLVAASCLGRAQRVLDEIISFSRERKQFGQPIGTFQAIQHRIADLATSVEAMRWLVYSTAWRLDTGQMPIKEICMAKLFCSEQLSEIANNGMRIYGGKGYLTEYAMQRHLRESFLGLYAGGTAEMQRNIIAGQIL